MPTSAVPAAPEPAPSRRRRRAPVRVARGLLRLVAGVLVAAAALVIAALLALRTEPVRRWALGLALDRLRDAVEGTVEVGRLGGDLLQEVVLEDVVVRGARGDPFLAVDRLTVEYELGALLRQEILLGDVELVRPRVRLVRAADGTWNATRIFPFLRGDDGPETPGGWGSVVRLSDLRVREGAATLESAPEAGGFGPLGQRVAVSGLDGSFSLAVREVDGGARRDVEARDVTFRLAEPTLDARELDLQATSTPDGITLRRLLLRTADTEISAEGDVRLAGAPPAGSRFPRQPAREQPLLDVRVAADPLSLAEAAPFVPALPFDEGTFRGRAHLRGPADALELAVEDGTLVTPRSHATVRGRLTTAGEAEVDATVVVAPLDPADARALWEGWPLDDPLRGTAQVRGTADRFAVDGEVGWSGTRAEFEGTVQPGGGRPAYDLRVGVTELDLADFLDGETWRSRVNGDFRVAGRGLGGETEAALAGEIRDSRLLVYDVPSAAFSGRFRPGAFEAESVAVRLARSEVRGSGIVGYDRTLAFDLSAVSADPSDFYPALGPMPARRFQAVGTLEGPFQGLDLNVTAASADSLAWKGLVADSLSATMQLLEIGQPAFTMRLEAAAGPTHYGPVDLEAAAFTAGFAGDTMGVAIEARMDSLRTASGHLDVDFSGAEPLVVIDRGEVRLRTGAWTIEEPSGFAFQAGEFRFDDFALLHDGQRVAVDGTLRVRGSQDLAFRADSLAISDVQALLGTAAPVEGVLAASGRLSGTDAAPVVEGELSLAEGHVGDVGVHRLEGGVGYADRRLRLDLELVPETVLADSVGAAAGVLAVDGTFPLDLAFHDVTRRLPDEPIDLTLESRDASLALVEAFVPLVREASGPLEVAVRLGGTPSAPTYDGAVRVQNGAFRAGRGGVLYTGVSGAVRFDTDEVVFEDVVVRSPTGDARLEGRVGIRELALGDVQATLLARQFTILEGDDRTLIVDADLELGGTTLEPSITGTVNVDQLEWPLPESTDKDVIDLDEAILYVRAAGDTVPEEPPPDVWRQTLLELDVSIEDDAFLRSDRALIVMEGDLTIEKPRGEGQPLIAGTLNVVRGFYSDFGAQFEVTEGEIFFYGTPELNPGLHVVATEAVENAATNQEVEVTLTVGGTVEEPTLNVTSVPEYEKSEIFSLLLFGTPYPGPGEEERFESTVTRVATRQAALPLQRALTSELGLDLLEIQPGVGVDGTRVRVGKYIRSNVFVTYSQAVGPREESQLGLQYRLSRNWTVETQAGTRQFGADLFYEFRY